jgi:uncharacterized delta-60 repeat protein
LRNLLANGGAIYLFDRLANGGALLDTLSFGLQAADLSLGRVPDASATWTLCLPTAASPNETVSLGNITVLKINEWMAASQTGSDWFELYNPQPQPVALGGLGLTDDLAAPGKYRIPPLSYIGGAEQGFAVFYADGNPAAGADHTNFRFNNNGEAIGLFTAASEAIDSIAFGPRQADVSEGRLPDGATNIVRFPVSATPGASNRLPTMEPPFITQQPTSQTRFVGQTATFTVEATGTPPLSFQWLFDGTPISGATNASLRLANLQFTQAGRYSLVVSNPLGSVTSAVATLTVLPVLPPQFCSGDPDASFRPPLSTWDELYALAVQPDGRILIGGESDFGGSPLTRWHADGSLDTTFATDLENEVDAIIVQPDAKILVSGWLNVQGRGLDVARVNPDGMLDSGLIERTNVDGSVNTIALQPDNKVLVAAVSPGSRGRSAMGWPA